VIEADDLGATAIVEGRPDDPLGSRRDATAGPGAVEAGEEHREAVGGRVVTNDRAAGGATPSLHEAIHTRSLASTVIP